MYDVVENARLKRYAAMIERFNEEYPGAWGLIYQTDVCTRLEHMPRVKAMLEDKHAKKIAKGKESDFNPEMPWDAVFDHVIHKEKEWWDTNIHRPGSQILSKAASAEKFVEGDAIVGGTGYDGIVQP